MLKHTPEELAALICSYFKKHLSEDYSPETLYRLYNATEDYLNRRFKKIVGKPPAKMLNQFRMERAAELLLSEDPNQSAIKNLPDAVGYRTEQGFLKAFKRHFHMYPTEYVLSKKGKPPLKNGS